jgi:peptidyl-prolyl cis-trans isomerase C
MQGIRSVLILKIAVQKRFGLNRFTTSVFVSNREEAGIMETIMPKRTILNVLLCVSIFLISNSLMGCNAATRPEVAVPVDTASPEVAVTETPAVQPPTPTTVDPNIPLAALVNGEGILLSEYEAEMQRYADAVAALGKPVDENQQKDAVLSELIDQVLLAHAAFEAGFSLDDASLEARITALGDAQALAAWMGEHGYDEASFRAALRRQAAASWQRDAIVAGVPASVEQVQARQILVFDQALAERLHKRLQDGADFATLARQIDPTGGELGWFPPGYLTQPEIEAAAFTLQPGQHSQVIATSFGYHIVQTIDRQSDRPVSAGVRRFLQHQALLSWLEQRRSGSDIEILLP